ncbi:hypothetical protein GCM10023188_20420 [Pontibacter saemangeumensis]|uniref:SGNH/GDSL hydrolase family protein n=1 Tax=Pontibacter saemangeumensis TaxID=1084525 RepID=A0ABP8LPK8_9BACT
MSDVDILFVGSSQVYRGFDVRIFESSGLKAFNLGTSAQTLFNTYYLLEEYLPTLNPEYIVLDLYWGVGKNDGVEPSIDIVSNSDLDENTLEMVFDLKNAPVYGTLFAACITRLRTPLHEIRQKEFKDARYIPGGFSESLITKNKLDPKKLGEIEPQNATLHDLQLEYLQKIIALCESRNKKLILVMTPVTKEYKRKVINYANYTNTIAKIAKENNIPYFDYNERKGLSLISSADFSDMNHLSQSGVEKFNGLFIYDLYTSGVLNPSLTLHKHKGPSQPSKSWQARKRQHTAVMRPSN